MKFTKRSLAAAISSVNTTQAHIKLTGGLDEVTSPYERKPGVLRTSQNFEVGVVGGYSTIEGYERFDGRAKPSAATYIIVLATITGSASLGDTVTGVTSAATGVIIALPGSAFVMTKVTGTFVSGESLQISAVTIATSTAAPSSALTTLLNAQYLNLAADSYRTDITAPTGSGNCLGGFYHNDINYCFRNNAGGTAAGLFKESTSGWTAVALGREMSFTSGGTYVIAEGDAIVGETSAATATVTRVVLETGTFAAGTAAGRLIFASQTGTFGTETIKVGANLNVANVVASAAITLGPNGRFEHIKENFGGSANTKRVYGCDGINRAWEFDGTVFAPIATGMTTDTPKFVYAHKKQLFLSFVGSVQHSAPGTPFIWSAITGAAEIAMGDTVTGFAGQPGSESGGALAIFTRNRLSLLYGNGVLDWVLTPYRDELGAFAYTIQDVGHTVFLDDRGITDIQSSQVYGNFAHNAISSQVLPFITANKPYAISSSISREKSQYRIFFTNKKALYITMVGRKIIGMAPMLFADIIRCTWTAETNAGDEVVFFGSDDGIVYQMDKGTSFDGDAIEFYFDLAYNFLQSPRVDKSFFDATAEIAGEGYAGFDFGYSLNYSSADTPQPAAQTTVTAFNPAYWDTFYWDSFYWDGLPLSPTTLPLQGMAENISLSIRGSSDYYSPIKFTAMFINYALRRKLRY